MPPEEADAGRLVHILEAAEEVRQFTAGKTYADFLHDRMFRLALERLIGIIGEAANKLSVSLRNANPQVPWADIIRARHIFVHDYEKLISTTVWRIATVHVPKRIELLNPLLPELPPDPEPEVEE